MMAVNLRRTRGQIALAMIYALLALNAWAQVILVPLGRSGDPPSLTALQVLVGVASVAAAWGSWAGTKWSPWAAVMHGVTTAAMLAALGPILDLGPDARGPRIGGVVVLLWDLGFAWYLYRVMNRPAVERASNGANMNDTGWRVLATYSSGFEADMVMAQLEAAEIPAIRDSNDTVGIFGAGFQGTTAQGFTIRVPAQALDEAREMLNGPGGKA